VAALRPGPLVAAFDNVSNKINSGALASAVTAWPAITSRLLGLSENIRMPLPAVWAVTGNNLRASTEIAQRSVRIRIDSGEENPGHRTGPQNGVGWRHPSLRRWFTANRGELVAAWLTLIRAWLAAGRPTAVVPAFGSFEQWTEIVGSILAFHGVHDLLSNRDEASDTMDDDKESWGAFMAWWAASGTLERTSGNLAALALNADGPGCPVDLTHSKDPATKMGSELAKLRDQRFGNHILRKPPRSSAARVWRLDPVK
jgi:putative DNA primase/helicase